MQEQQRCEQAQLKKLKKLEKGQAQALVQAQAQAQVHMAVAEMGGGSCCSTGCTGAVSEGLAAGVAAIASGPCRGAGIKHSRGKRHRQREDHKTHPHPNSGGPL